MKGTRMVSAVVAAAVALGSTASGQQEPQRAAGTVKAGVTAVLVDLVVRDKKGEPVRDLKQSEIQLTEDGVPQTVASFAPVFDNARAPVPAAPAGGESASAPPAVGAPPPVDAGPTVTALVFDRLTPE